MNRAASLVVQAALVFGVIVLPQPERAAILDESITRGRMAENGYIVADAAERYAESLGGIYPYAVAAFDNYLPGRTALANSVHMLRTEPVDGQAGSAGQVGYVSIYTNGYAVGYNITVFGSDATQGPNGDGIMFELQQINDPPPPPVVVPD